MPHLRRATLGLSLLGLVTLGGSTPAAATIVQYAVPDHFLSQGTDPHFTGLVLTEHDPLFAVDLAALVSKYIGDTEKNLGSLFATAGAASAILIFDEADALFGKRTDVHDAHDRYGDDFIVIDSAADPTDGLHHWHGQIFLTGIDGVADGVYPLAGTAELTLVAEPASLGLLLSPALLLIGALRRRRPA